MQAYEQQSKKKLIATVVTVLVVAGLVVLVDQLRSKDSAANAASPPASGVSSSPATTTQTENTPATSESTSSTASSGTYKDGTYTASIGYNVPPGQESIDVTLTVKDQAVTDVSIKNSENDRESAEFQADFANSYKSKVVGKKLSGLTISAIAGASDTTEAFNNALEQIAAKAQT